MAKSKGSHKATTAEGRTSAPTTKGPPNLKPPFPKKKR